MSRNWPVIVMRVFAILLERFLPAPASLAKPILNHTLRNKFNPTPRSPCSAWRPTPLVVGSSPPAPSRSLSLGSAARARPPGTRNARVCARSLVRRERQDGVRWGGLSVLFSLGSTKRFLFRRHVPSSPDGPIPSRNVALPGAERLVFYRNAELLHVDRTERTFASFTYE